MPVSTFLRQRALEYRMLADQIPYDALRNPLLRMAWEWEQLADKCDADRRKEAGVPRAANDDAP